MRPFPCVEKRVIPSRYAHWLRMTWFFDTLHPGRGVVSQNDPGRMALPGMFYAAASVGVVVRAGVVSSGGSQTVSW